MDSGASQTLSPAQKFALAIEPWDELASHPNEIPVTDEQLNELDRRFDVERITAEQLLNFKDQIGLMVRGGKLHGSRATYREAQSKALNKGPHSSYKRKQEAQETAELDAIDEL